MQHDVDVLARLLRDRELAEVALDERELQALVGVDREDVVQVALVARQEIVDADDGLAEIEQALEQRRSDEAGDAGHEPAARRVHQIRTDVVVSGHRIRSLATRSKSTAVNRSLTRDSRA